MEHSRPHSSPATVPLWYGPTASILWLSNRSTQLSLIGTVIAFFPARESDSHGRNGPRMAYHVDFRFSRWIRAPWPTVPLVSCQVKRALSAFCRCSSGSLWFRVPHTWQQHRLSYIVLPPPSATLCTLTLSTLTVVLHPWFLTLFSKTHLVQSLHWLVSFHHMTRLKSLPVALLCICALHTKLLGYHNYLHCIGDH